MLQPGKTYTINIPLWETSNVFKKDHQIRLHITSSNFPASTATSTQARIAATKPKRTRASRPRPSTTTISTAPRCYCRSFLTNKNLGGVLPLTTPRSSEPTPKRGHFICNPWRPWSLRLRSPATPPAARDTFK
jgi:hypothetical protein